MTSPGKKSKTRLAQFRSILKALRPRKKPKAAEDRDKEDAEKPRAPARQQFSYEDYFAPKESQRPLRNGEHRRKPRNGKSRLRSGLKNPFYSLAVWIILLTPSLANSDPNPSPNRVELDDEQFRREIEELYPQRQKTRQDFIKFDAKRTSHRASPCEGAKSESNKSVATSTSMPPASWPMNASISRGSDTKRGRHVEYYSGAGRSENDYFTRRPEKESPLGEDRYRTLRNNY